MYKLSINCSRKSTIILNLSNKINTIVYKIYVILIVVLGFTLYKSTSSLLKITPIFNILYTFYTAPIISTNKFKLI